MKKLNVCLVTKLTNGLFFNCVKSIKEKTLKDTLDNMIISVCYTGDNPSDVKAISDFLAYEIKLPYHIIQMPYNYAKCNNSLSKLTNLTDYLLFLNDDVMLIDDCITHCIKVLDSDKDHKFGSIGVKLLYADKTIQHAGQMMVISSYENNFIGVTHYYLKHSDILLPDYVSFGNTGAFLMIRKSDFDECGRFNEKYHHCFEDVELNMNLLSKGKLNICCGSVSAYHLESQTRHQELSHEDIHMMVDFYNRNKNLILQNKDILTRTIIER